MAAPRTVEYIILFLSFLFLALLFPQDKFFFREFGSFPGSRLEAGCIGEIEDLDPLLALE